MKRLSGHWLFQNNSAASKTVPGCANSRSASSNKMAYRWPRDRAVQQHTVHTTMNMFGPTTSVSCPLIGIIFHRSLLLVRILTLIPFFIQQFHVYRELKILSFQWQCRWKRSAPSSESIQISPSSPPSDDALLRPHCPFKLTILMRIGKHMCLARTLETLSIDVLCPRDSYSRFQRCHSIDTLTKSFDEVPFAPFW